MLAVLVVLAAAGAIYESSARTRELAQVSAPGQMVDVGGYRMHIFCLGQSEVGDPTVLLEAGAGGWSIHWHEFQREVSQYARVCAYDRAGYGWSDSGPRPRHGVRIAEELHALLAGSGETGPYVLVGASRGGQYIRLFRDAYPGEVVGMVLVDAEPEDFRTLSPVGKQAATQNMGIFPVLGFLNRVGAFRIMGGDPTAAPEVPCIPFLVKSLPPEEHSAYLAVEGQPKCYDAYLGEESATVEREAQVRSVQPLGDLPLVVLTHGITNPPGPGVTPEQAAEVERVWQDLQKKQAALSSAGTLVLAAESGHNIAIDQPELVHEAVRQMLQ